MEEQKLYLKQNLQVEPLINHWYAWPHLIAPHTAAMNVANSHLKIMQSYVQAPRIHADAVKNPAMRGGPFIDLNGTRVDEIRALIDETLNRQRTLIKFAEGIKTLDNLLANEAKGFSIEPLYQRVPAPLKGYVELTYDLNNNPSIRFIEGLLFKSLYYDRSLQGIVLSLTDRDYRPFVFSTPRLSDDAHLHIDLPFDDAGIDELFKMKEVPQSFGYIKDVLRFEDICDDLFRSFLTQEPPPARPDYNGDGIRIRYMGHACLLIESRSVTILVDPVISYDFDSPTPRFTYADLPETIDYVLITHAHSDHVLFETLLQLRHKVRNLIVPKNGGGRLEDPSLRLILQNIGFKNVSEIDEMQTLDVDGGTITGLPFLGEHADLAVRSKLGYLVRLAGRSVLCAADSRNVENDLYQHIHSQIGDVDVLFIGMECDGAPLTWIYGQLLTKPLNRKMDDTRRLHGSDYERAISIIKTLRCGQVYIYAMGQEPWLTYVIAIQYTDKSKPITESDRVIETCRGQGMNAERLFCQKEIFV
jgi:L-ascorbate metabolism protein UlaG (beta-lactamase superfamily)